MLLVDEIWFLHKLQRTSLLRAPRLVVVFVFEIIWLLLLVLFLLSTTTTAVVYMLLVDEIWLLHKLQRMSLLCAPRLAVVFVFEII